MPTYKLSPFATFVESHLIAASPQYAVFHRFTGQMAEPGPSVRELLYAAKAGSPVSVGPEQITQLGEDGLQIQRLIELELLIPDGHDPLASFVEYYVGRPLQNPALTYRGESGEVLVVSISMAERFFSPEVGQLPVVIEERFSELATKILLAADGTQTLRHIHTTLNRQHSSLLDDQDFRDAIDFLSRPERQLIKCVSNPEGFADPFYPANLVPRNLYHSTDSKRPARGGDSKSLTDFHQKAIENAKWEFDVIEPTINHAFRFPNDALGGLSYGARFCQTVLHQQVLARAGGKKSLNILEVGAGTGAFARAFLQQVQAERINARYHILDLSPILIESQRRALADVEPPVKFFHDDATAFHIADAIFDLIIANEVIADFPVAEIRRDQIDKPAAGETSNALNHFREWTGEGAKYIGKYDLSTDDAPGSFLVNAGVFEFLERAWQHLAPGGAVVLTEYGSPNIYPVEAHHLNHSEFSIHFGHVIQCAQKLGFVCRLQTLSDFLEVDERVSVLNGSNEHIQCLDHVFQKFGEALGYRLITEREFRDKFQKLVDSIDLRGFSFQPLLKNFHYGPNLHHFMALIVKKPLT